MNRLKELRQQRGYSLRKLESLSGVDQATISQIENGRQKSKDVTLARLAQALEVEPAEFKELVDTTAAARGRKGQLSKQAKQAQSKPAEVIPAQAQAQTPLIGSGSGRASARELTRIEAYILSFGEPDSLEYRLVSGENFRVEQYTDRLAELKTTLDIRNDYRGPVRKWLKLKRDLILAEDMR